MRWHTISDIGWYGIGSICLGHNWTVTSDIFRKFNLYGCTTRNAIRLYVTPIIYDMPAHCFINKTHFVYSKKQPVNLLIITSVLYLFATHLHDFTSHKKFSLIQL